VKVGKPAGFPRVAKMSLVPRDSAVEGTSDVGCILWIVGQSNGLMCEAEIDDDTCISSPIDDSIAMNWLRIWVVRVMVVSLHLVFVPER
jgi:hypothetical protein